LPPDGNCLLSVTDHCLRSTNYVNVIVADKQNHLQFLSMADAITHCTKGIGLWPFASNDYNATPDLVMASCGDVSTHEALAATALLRQHLPQLKIRFVNVVDLFKLISHENHPHGLTDAQYVSLFTSTKPVIFNFHSYPFLVHRLTYRRPGANENLHVRGYNEKGNIDTPLELAIRNKTDRYSLAMDAIDRLVGVLGDSGSGVREMLLDEQIRMRNWAFENGMDPVDITEWKWPFSTQGEGKSAGVLDGVQSLVGGMKK
jgi:xylulose-5-phosphate/fructose-6-phosphate phosphoketolase